MSLKLFSIRFLIKNYKKKIIKDNIKEDKKNITSYKYNKKYTNVSYNDNFIEEKLAWQKLIAKWKLSNKRFKPR